MNSRALTLFCQHLCFAMVMTIAITPTANAEQTTIAVASNFSGAMNEIITAFEVQSAHKVKIAYGATGKLYAQIQNGAPFDAFFSADQQAPQRLVQAGFALADSRFTYAIGALALWSTIANSNNLARLQQGDFNKLALANPKLAPYGAAAREVLSHLQLLENTQNRWVQGENIAQTYQFVSTGNADLGFVALSQIMRKGQLISGSAWTIPTNIYQPIRQDAVQLKRAKNNAATTALLEFVHSETTHNILRAYGYQSAH